MPKASSAMARPGAWKLPFDSISQVSATTSGLSAALFNSSSTCVARRRQRGERGAVHLRDAAKRQRVLHAARGTRLPQRAAREQLAKPRGHGVLSGRRPRRLHPRVERAQVGAKAFVRQRSGDVQRIEHAPAHRGGPAPRAPTVAAFELISARPSLPVSVAGARPACASAAAPVIVAPRNSASPSPMSGSARCDSGARSATPIDPMPGTTGMHAGVEHRDERVEHRRRNARAAHGHAGGAGEHHRPHHIGRQARTDADGARAARRAPGRRPAPPGRDLLARVGARARW